MDKITLSVGLNLNAGGSPPSGSNYVGYNGFTFSQINSSGVIKSFVLSDTIGRSSYIPMWLGSQSSTTSTIGTSNTLTTSELRQYTGNLGSAPGLTASRAGTIWGIGSSGAGNGLDSLSVSKFNINQGDIEVGLNIESSIGTGSNNGSGTINMTNRLGGPQTWNYSKINGLVANQVNSIVDLTGPSNPINKSTTSYNIYNRGLIEILLRRLHYL